MSHDQISGVEPTDAYDTTQLGRQSAYAVYEPPRTVGPLELFVSPIVRWRLLVALAVAAALLSSALSLVLPSRFTVSASFTADEGDQARLPSGLAGLASQFGLSDGLSGSSSPQFYADLVRSRSIIRALLSTAVPAGDSQAPVIDLLGASDENPIRRAEQAEQTMRDRIDVSFDRTTQRIDVQVWMRRPETAKAVADSILALVDRFDRDIRRTRAGEKRAFAERQRGLAADSLHIAEDSMARFLAGNRAYQQSAQLQFQHDRLQRVIALRQELYLALAREAAESRINEVDTRPVLTVIDPPLLPGRRTSPRRKLLVLASTLIAVSLAWLVLVLSRLWAILIRDDDSDVGRAISLVRGVLHPGKDLSGLGKAQSGG